MKIVCCRAIILALLLAISQTGPSTAEEMRTLQLEARQARQELSRKALREKEDAQQAAVENRRHITRDRDALSTEIARLRAANADLSQEIDQYENKRTELTKKEQSLAARLEQVGGMVRELAGIMRSNAKDLVGLIKQNGQSQPVYDHYSFLVGVAESETFPSMDEMKALHGALLEQIRRTGEVFRSHGPIIDRAGLEVSAEVLFIGPFTSAYRAEEETGFLNYSSSGNTLYALSNLPPGKIRKDIAAYMDGKQDTVPVDISRGAALRQLNYRKDLFDRIGGGGPIVWPILAILVFGLLIVGERLFTLFRKHHKNVPVFERIGSLIRENDWAGCERVCREYESKPIARVLLAGVDCHDLAREDMENVLQGAILQEIPVLERFLSTLGMLVAIAPLLGLLGTVTGMINVFHVITLSGTGDPRLMSGGISEALVTTMLGLGVAIPLMLLHNVLNRTVDRMVAEMEEKSVALVNMIHKQRNAG